MKGKLIVIAGATASGKTNTAVEIAKAVNGEIISCDSMQIYKNMDIGTAKVTAVEMDGIPHHMINIVEAHQSFSVGDFSIQATKHIDEILCKGKTPILCGGTGLYIDSILYPFGVKIDENPQIRAELYDILNEKGADYLHSQLKTIDPIDAEKIHPNNIKRLVRALEIFKVSGKTKTEQLTDIEPKYDFEFNVLDWDRAILYDRINKRVEIMFDNGLLEEVKRLLDSNITFDMQSMQAIGYKEFKPYFNGEISIEKVKDTIAQNSRNYAKRQITWFKKYQSAMWLTPVDCIKKYKG